MKRISVTVVDARVEGAVEVSIELPAGSTVAEALLRAALPGCRGKADVAALTVGVYGARVAPEAVLANRDRVEIYRPLLADPKEARRRRAPRRGRR